MKVRTFIFFAVFLCLAVSCRTSKVEHVVFIGLDGLSSEAFEAADMPFVKSLLPKASYTVRKRSVLPSSSAVNWATMFSGSCPELHGYTRWDSMTPDLPSRVILENDTYPTLFQIYRDKYRNAEMGCFYDWDGIKYLIDTLSFNFYGTPSSGEYADIRSITADVCKYISGNNPDFTVVVFDNPDSEGHSYGWCSSEYMSVLTKLDKSVSAIFNAAADAGFTEENTVFVITSDHGGIGTNHGDKSLNELEAPFIILGKGIRRGYCFDDISMMQFDVASTLAALLDLEQPQPWVGRSMPVSD